MSYTNEYKKDMEQYQSLLIQYNEYASSPVYQEIYERMPFEFLNAKQKAETLDLYQNLGKKSVFKFTRADDAISFYNSVCDLRKNVDDLLEKASCVVEASKIADKLNDLVDNSVYLPNNLKIESSSRIVDMAKECIVLLPEYPNMMTKSFLYSFIEGCIDSLNKNGIEKMVDLGIIRSNMMKEIRLYGSDTYKENIAFLQEKFNLPTLLAEHHIVRLKGTSFKNENGTDRQEILATLKDAEKPVDIQCVPTIYTPEVGNPENAVEVHWKESCLGYVPKDVVGQMYKKYKDPQFEGEFKQVIGGGSAKYGCEIDLGVVAMEYAHPEKEDAQHVPEKE